MGKTLYGSEIPRFTKEDEEKLVKEHWDDHITPSLKFSDLYKHKISSVYTPLPEYVYKKWYFQRIMTIGDAAHKVCISNFLRPKPQSNDLNLVRAFDWTRRQ